MSFIMRIIAKKGGKAMFRYGRKRSRKAVRDSASKLQECFVVFSCEEPLDITQKFTSGNLNKALSDIWASFYGRKPVFSTKEGAFDHLLQKTLSTESSKLIFRLEVTQESFLKEVKKGSFQWHNHCLAIYDDYGEPVWERERDRLAPNLNRL